MAGLAEGARNRGLLGVCGGDEPVKMHMVVRAAIVSMIRLGGDTDTTAAIVGAITGAQVSKAGIPQPWLDNLWEWPRTVTWMEELAGRLAGHCEGTTLAGALPLNALSLLARNLVFMLIVLVHGFRRLLPPY